MKNKRNTREDANSPTALVENILAGLPHDYTNQLPATQNHERPRLLSVVDAAKMLDLSPWTVRKCIAQGDLLPVRIGRRVLLEERELCNFIAANRSISEKQP